MINIETKGNKIYTITAGKLDKVDYEKMLPLVKEKTKKYNAIHWYFQMKDFKGWTANAFWCDMNFDLGNAAKSNKLVIVGDKKWQVRMTEIMKFFIRKEIRCFDEAEGNNAKEWVSTNFDV